VWRNEHLIISKETRGGAYTGTYYREGTDYFLEESRAYQLINGFDLKYLEGSITAYRELDHKKYYLLIFDPITIPTVFTPMQFKPAIEKDCYAREELEHLRQLTWAGELQVPSGMLRVEMSHVTGFGWTSKKEGKTTYRACSKWNCLEQTEIFVAGNKFLFNSRW
jgi:hypothetical protein